MLQSVTAEALDIMAGLFWDLGEAQRCRAERARPMYKTGQRKQDGYAGGQDRIKTTLARAMRSSSAGGSGP